MIKSKSKKIVLLIAIIFTFLMSNILPVFAALTHENATANLKILILHEGGEEASGTLTSDQEALYDTNPYGYYVGETRVYKIVEDGDYSYSNAFYCLDGTMSFPGATALSFSNVADMADTDNINVKGLNFGTTYANDSTTWIKNYNSLMWLTENMFLKKQTPEQKDEYLEKAFADYDDWDLETVKAFLTDDDIDVVQQYAIWYFTNGDTAKFNVETLPEVQLIKMDNTTGTYNDITGFSYRQSMASHLYNYLITSAKSAKSEKLTYPSIEQTDPEAIFDENGDLVIGPFKVNGGDVTSGYDVSLIDQNGDEINIDDYGILIDGTEEFSELTVDEILDQEYYIYLYNEEVTELYLNLTYTTYETKSSLWKETTVVEGADPYQPVILITRETTPYEDSVGVEIERVESDLALRKYIVKVNETEYNREPNIDTMDLMDGFSTTANYYHQKDPIEVSVGDRIVYEIRVYNEADTEATGTYIQDILPKGLELATNSTINEIYNWIPMYEGDNTVVYSTDYLSEVIIESYQGTDVLPSDYVQIECVVTDDVVGGTELTNVAEIEYTDNYDRDSEPYNTSTFEDTTGYTGSEFNKENLSDSDYYYMGEEDDDDFEKVVIAENIDISVEKIWNDNDNQDNLRPASVTVALKNGQTTVDTATIDETSNWKHTFTGLPKKENGTEINYTVEETEVPTGYTVSYTGDAENGFTVTNTHELETTEVKVTKVWSDNNNQDNLRPASVTIALKNGQTTVDTATIDEKTNWTHTFTNLPKYANGTEINYTVEEIEVPTGYTVSYTGDAENGFTVTNTHELETTEVKVTKVWSDNNNQDNLRSASVTIALKNGQTTVDTATIDEETNWTHTFTNLPKYANGTEINYTVEETEVPTGYTVSYTGDAENGFTVTNTHELETTEVKVTKVWSDNNNQDNLRPASVTIALKNGQTTVDTATIDEKTNWTHTFTNLPKYANGTEINYTVEETEVPTGYTVSYTGDAENGFTVTNTHELETTEVKVTKVWSDNNNQDNLRPASVTIALKNGQTTVDTATIDEKTNWTHTFTNLPKYANGTEINYTVEETEVPTGYTVSYTGDAENGFTVTNTHEPETTDIYVEKVWEDNENQDNLRPTEIEVSLKANETEVGTAILNAKNGWCFTFTDLAVNENGTPIEYTVEETNVPEGYTVEYTDNLDDTFTITNTHELETTEVKVTKVWSDNNNQDNLRPASVTIALKNGQTTVDTATIDEKTNWTHTFTNLPKYANGTEINYTVEETEVPTGYTVSYTGDAENGFTVTNTHELETTEVKVTKVWSDNNNQDNLRPASVTIALKNGQTTVDTATIDEKTNWTHTFTNLPKYANGTEINYTVEEIEVPTGYTVSYTGDAENGFTVTNTHELETTEVKVTKVWSDNNNQDNLRSASVTIALKNGQTTVDTATIDEETNWTHTFTNLPKYANGTEINYTVEETEVPTGYTVSYTGDAENGFTITNTHEPETTEVKVTKVWSDNNNQDNLRLASVTIALKNGQTTVDTATIDEKTNWTHTFTNLPKYANGTEINYTVEETEVPTGYTVSYTGDAENGFTVTNTHKPETTDIYVEKVWEDNENQDNLRPEEIEVSLKANETEVGTAILNAKNGWCFTFTDLAVNENGTPIEYTVEEINVPEGYTVEYTDNLDDTFTITNTHIPGLINIDVEKIWEDNNNQDGKRPESITVELLANGTSVKTATIKESEGWKYTFTGLEEKANGTSIEYAIKEVEVAEYTSVVTGNMEEGFTITNTHEPETTEVKVTKAWSDNNNQDNLRLASVTIALKNGQTTVDTATIDEKTNWTHTFTNLPKYANGTEINYTVEETEVPTGYTVSYTGDAENGFTVTNIHEPETTDIYVEKVWEDNENQDNLRPEEIEVSLKANETEVRTSILNAKNGWCFTFTNLPKYANGTEINYTVEETEVPTGYTVSYTGDAENGFTVTNTHEPEETERTVTKVWDDSNDEDQIRPTEITILLKANGTNVGSTKLNESNNWTYTFDELAKYANGREIIYSVEEANVPTGYTVSYSINTENVFIITNKHIAGKINIPVEKVWDDNDNQDGIRTEEVSISLKNGDTVVETVTLNKHNDWKYTFTNIDKKIDGEIVEYTVVENNVPTGYEATITGNTNLGFKVTNTHEPEKIDIPVEKVWDDENDVDGLRVDSVIITIKYKGVEVDRVELNEENEWKHIFTGLDKFSNGREIEYSVEEINIPTGYTPIISGNQTEGFIVTNRHIPGKVNVSVEKVWEDNENSDNLRTEKVTILLMANETEIDRVELNEENEWKHIFEELDEMENGELIEYYVEELEVPEGYTVSINEIAQNIFKVTNTHEPEKIDIPVEKVWVDNNNQDGIRPENIEIILKNAETEVDRITLNEENEWKHTFTGLVKKSAGNEIEYTVEEVDVPEKYTSEITGNIVEGFTITNTYVPEKINIKVDKVWEDYNDEQKLRPETITIILKANETEVSKAELNQENSWTYTFTNLDKKSNGENIIYTVEELNVTNGYTSKITGNMESGFIVTNTIIPEKIDIPVEKVWDDENDIDEIRPNKVTINLLANDKVIDTVDLKEENEWKHTFTDLDKKINGENVNYTVVEAIVPEEYTVEITGNIVEGFTVTNTHTPRVREFDMSLQKFISKLNGKKLEVNREPVVDVKPLKQGEKDAKYTLVKNPLVVTKGDIITYTIRVYNEGEIAGYAEEISDYLPEGLGYLVNHKDNNANKWSIPEDTETLKLNSIIKNIYNLNVDDFENVEKLEDIEVVKGKVKLTSNKLASNSTNNVNLIEGFNIKNGNSLKYKDVEIICVVLEDEVKENNFKNLAEITKDSDENKQEITDRDSTPDTVDPNNYPGDDKNQDDNDYENLITEKDIFDLTLQKFISKVNSEDIKDRETKVSKDENGKLVYKEATEPIRVENNDVITYTIRVYNEGNISGYASEISDNLPEGLEFLSNNEINKKYGWKLYDKDGKETTDLDKAKTVKTDYLSKEKSEARKEDNLIDAYNSAYAEPDYRDVQIVFKVIESEAKSLENRIIKNIAEITEAEDPKGNEVEDIDSIPGNNKDGEDDIDDEKLYVKYFDLSLQKDLVKIIITEDGKTREIQVSPNTLQKVEVHRKRIDTTIVKFVYRITVKNEGEIAGYAKEIKDYVPAGLDFIASENPGWTEISENVITTNVLANTKIEPGKTASVDVVLKWINGENNFDRKINTAEISGHENECNTPDIDSTPNNKISGEDDIDTAEVILSISTGTPQTYIILSLIVFAIMACGIVLIKKYVLVKED